MPLIVPFLLPKAVNMVFSDLFFIFRFLPLFLVCYFFTDNIKVKNAALIVFSLIFYSWGEPVWVVLLLISSLLDFLNGRYIAAHRGEKKAINGVIASCVVDLGILAVFKYSAFAIGSLNSLLGTNIPFHEFHLPIGISFYTFQSITYVVDVYRGKQAQKNYFSYLLYLSMFFQLVAGPIVRYSDVAREINHRDSTTDDFSRGISRFVMGLGKKVLLANTCGALADSMLGAQMNSVLAAWCGVIAYSLQIYYDFSGYSDMAIGLGSMCGFHFPENFDHPYVSRSVTEFWRRWHISLGTFFRDYVYIPLGGNRKHQLMNILVVWFCTGLWHGASTNFILWGLYFAVFLILEKKYLLGFFERIPKFFSHIYLLLIVVIGWALFYFTDLSSLLNCLSVMVGNTDLPATDIYTISTLKGNMFILAAAVLLCTPLHKLVTNKLTELEKKNGACFVLSGAVRIIALLAVFALSSVMLVGDTYNPFLYYRF